MKARNKLVGSLGTALFWIGVALGLALAGGAAWADIEAKFYGFQQFTKEPLTSLRCPVLMTTADSEVLSATFRNRLDRPINLTVSADISTPGLPITERVVLPMEPGQTVSHEWALRPQEVDLGSFIFARVLQFPTYGQPIRESTCGILVLPIPSLTGRQVFALVLLGSLLGILAGLGLWQQANRPLTGRRRSNWFAMTILALLVLAAVLASLMGSWLVAGVFLVLAVLLIASLAYFALTS